MNNYPKRVWKGADEPIRKGKIVNQVYETSDYSIFKLHKRNRNVITRKDMLKQAKEGIINPIMVNGEMIVIDGQNRLHHSIEVGVPIKYIIDESLTVDDITRMNTNQEKWSLKDWVESFANEGRKEYEKLVYILNNHNSDISLVSGLCIGTVSASVAADSVKSGNFKIINYEMIISFFHYFNRFLEETNANKNSPTAKALYQLFTIKKLDKDRLIKKVITTRFDEELRDKRLTQTAVLKGLLESYNDRLNGKSGRYLKYHIKSNNQIVLEEELHGWAKKKTANQSDQ
ncbi:MAG TPA: hypothetical protein VLA13_10060 [Massilibacterium sp.]|nr:hypothetical protein [Massilibacterium sp.]